MAHGNSLFILSLLPAGWFVAAKDELSIKMNTDEPTVWRIKGVYLCN